jgi:UDP:flavonoid glycosyltransferase YjiC (YdhE family)
MSLIRRVLGFCLVPLLALVTYQSLSAEQFQSINNAIQPHLSKLPFGITIPGALPPPSETPIFISAMMEWSHVEKIASVAVALAELGYPITFITARVFSSHISGLHPNIQFAALQGPDEQMTEKERATFESLPHPDANNYRMMVVLMDRMADIHNTMQEHYEQFRQTYGQDKPLISLFDCTLTGHHPILLGAPGIRPDAMIGINLHPLTLDSNDTFPFSVGKPPHQGPDRLEVHRKAYAEVEEAAKGTSDYWWGKLKELGTMQETYPTILQAMNTLPDHLLTLGVPEFEFPRSDLRSNVRYFGAFKKVGKKGSGQLPSWWDDIAEAKKEGKKIVLVSQGTLEAEFKDLTLPTLDVLKDRSDVLVIATFAVMEPEEVPGLVVPDNARVAKFVPFDILLPLVCCVPVVLKVRLLTQPGRLASVKRWIRSCPTLHARWRTAGGCGRRAGQTRHQLHH